MLSKLVSTRLERPRSLKEAFYFGLTPLFSIESWRKAKPRVPGLAGRALLRAVGWSALLVGAYFVYFAIFRELNGAVLPELGAPLWPIPYIAVFPATCVGLALGSWFQFFGLSLGREIPPHHVSPLLARNVAEFWGSRWNTWFSDWCRQVLLRPFTRRYGAIWGIFAVFLYSGVWHELVINVPALVFGGFHFLGGMLLYFLLQPVGILIDRAVFRPDQRVLRRLWLFVVVALPSPLVLNEAMLRIVGLWPFERF
jgi:hypothetical protein